MFDLAYLLRKKRNRNRLPALNRARDAGIHAGNIGTVGGQRFVIEVDKGQWSDGCRIDLPVDQVYDRWAFAIERTLDQA